MAKIFRPQDIDRLIPELEKIFAHMDACQRRTQVLAESRPPQGAEATAAEIAESARIRSQMEFLLEVVEDDITLVSELGGVVKDLSAGLVDFPGRVQGDDVWLCWKRGEQKINFWHPLYAGFSERQALPRSENRTSTTH